MPVLLFFWEMVPLPTATAVSSNVLSFATAHDVQNTLTTGVEAARLSACSKRLAALQACGCRLLLLEIP